MRIYVCVYVYILGTLWQVVCWCNNIHKHVTRDDDKLLLFSMRYISIRVVVTVFVVVASTVSFVGCHLYCVAVVTLRVVMYIYKGAYVCVAECK